MKAESSKPTALPEDHAASEPPRSPARARILRAAGDLFNREGVQAVGVDRVIEAAGVAKASLYKHFASKDDLIAAWLEEVSADWFAWADQEVRRRAPSPAERPLALFDVLGSWFATESFRGCPFINISGEVGDPGSRARAISSQYKRDVGAYVLELCRQAGLADPEKTALLLTLLMDGATVRAAMQGEPSAAVAAKAGAALILGRSGKLPRDQKCE